MTLYFRSSKNERRFLCDCNNRQDVFDAMNKFMDDHNFKSYYTRIWRHDDEVWFDVGSHTEYFVLIDKENKFGVE